MELVSELKTVHARHISPVQEAQILERYTTLADTIDGYISGAPNVKDMDAVEAWMRELQSLSASLADQCARAEGFFALAVMQSVEQIPETVWKRIGKSSTLTTQYVAGLYESRFTSWQRLNNLKSVVKTVMDNTRTMIVSVREERRTHDAGNVRNSDAMFPGK